MDDPIPSLLKVEPSKNGTGYVVWSNDEYTVEVWRMMFNWRLVAYVTGDDMNVLHGYCYFGTELRSLALAVIAGQNWKDVLNAEPEGYDKKAF
jgi:hypothetical protein